MAIFDEKIEIRERCKGVHCVDLGERFPTSIYLQTSASIQPRTSPSKFGQYYSNDNIVHSRPYSLALYPIWDATTFGSICDRRVVGAATVHTRKTGEKHTIILNINRPTLGNAENRPVGKCFDNQKLWSAGCLCSNGAERHGLCKRSLCFRKCVAFTQLAVQTLRRDRFHGET